MIRNFLTRAGKRSLLFLGATAACFFLFGQSSQNEFLEARRLFASNDFKNAKSAFAGLFEDEAFGSYSIFYAGLASYNLQDVDGANSIWRQLPSRYPNWDQLGEVYYWLMLSSFQLEEYENALNYGIEFNKRFESDLPARLSRIYLPPVRKEVLIDLNSKFPANTEVAKALAQQLDKYDLGESTLLRKLIIDFDLDVSDFAGVTLGSEYKEGYAIGVLLPFMFEDVGNMERAVSNRVIMDLYQGMKLAEQQLQLEDNDITLYPFDTKRKEEVTREVLADQSMKKMDLLVGPLFGGPIAAANEFSRTNKINIFNPVSSNLDIVGDNPFAFLLKPSYQTMAEALAKRACANLTNKNALVYFSDDVRDSTFAQVYKDRIEADSFNVIEFRSVDNLLSKAILDSLTEQHEEFIATLEEVDSLLEIPGRFIKERKPDLEDSLEAAYALVRIDEEGEPGDSLIYYEMKYNVVEDSIGHIMIASRDNGIVNNFIGAVETRPDSLGLLGYGNWQEFKVVDYNQLERLQINLANPQYFDKSREKYQEVTQLVIDTYKCPPSNYHLLGYETIYYLGKMLVKHGKYFQNGFLKEGMVEGQLMTGFDFGINSDNQVVPIVTMRNGALIPINAED